MGGGCYRQKNAVSLKWRTKIDDRRHIPTVAQGDECIQGLGLPKDRVLCVLCIWRLGNVTVERWTCDLEVVGFNSRSGRYQVTSTWMGDCLQTGKLSRYITNTKVNSAFHPSGVGKSSTGLHAWG